MTNPRNWLDIPIGTIYGRLTVIRRAGSDKNKNFLWFCRCSCGKTKTVLASRLSGGRTASCGCLRVKEGTAFRNIFCLYKHGAKRRELIFKLNEDEFRQLTSSPCFYCGHEPSNIQKSVGGEIYKYNGIDRKNNFQGYAIDNCISCCWECNKLKGKRNIQEFLNHIKRLADHSAWTQKDYQFNK
jgi:hypothetical protein